MAVPIDGLHPTLLARVVYFEQRFDPFTVYRVTEYYYDDAIITVCKVRAFRENIHFYV